MKMVQCMEDEALACPKGEIRSEVTQKKQVNPSNGSKGHNKHKWGQGKPRPPNNKEKLVSKKPLIKKVKWDMSKVKCFNCDNGNLVKDCPKPPQISDYIAQSKLKGLRGQNKGS
jgi:hypothetical protein